MMVRIRFRIHYRHRQHLRIFLLSVVGLAVALVAIIQRMEDVSASSQRFTSGAIQGVRHYYLTDTLHTGDNVVNACAPGYHFASVWEIADPSSLKYDTTWGLTSPDSGSGPPVAIDLFGVYHVLGWVRTGYTDTILDTPGQANCAGWTSSGSRASGTVANLPSSWDAGEQDIGVWNVGISACNYSLSVWCVQDDSLWNTYLPAVLLQ
jgi:hypothetical protein